MLLTNRQAQYKYSSTGFQMRQEKVERSKKSNNGQFSFLAKAFKIFLVVGVIGIAVIFYVNQFARISSLNYQTLNLKKEVTALEKENEKIRLQIAENKSLRNIEKEAKERLGLVEPANNGIYYLSVDKGSDKEVKPTTQTEEKGKLTLLASEVGSWFKNLTSVEAGTLDE